VRILESWRGASLGPIHASLLPPPSSRTRWTNHSRSSTFAVTPECLDKPRPEWRPASRQEALEDCAVTFLCSAIRYSFCCPHLRLCECAPHHEGLPLGTLYPDLDCIRCRNDTTPRIAFVVPPRTSRRQSYLARRLPRNPSALSLFEISSSCEYTIVHGGTAVGTPLR